MITYLLSQVLDHLILIFELLQPGDATLALTRQIVQTFHPNKLGSILTLEPEQFVLSVFMLTLRLRRGPAGLQVLCVFRTFYTTQTGVIVRGRCRHGFLTSGKTALTNCEAQ